MSGSDARALSRSLLDLCRMRKLTIATAESCTGGLVAGALTDIPGSSDVIDRGFVTYSNEAKRAMLGVKATTLATFGAVSKETASRSGRCDAGQAGRPRAFRRRRPRRPNPASRMPLRRDRPQHGARPLRGGGAANADGTGARTAGVRKTAPRSRQPVASARGAHAAALGGQAPANAAGVNLGGHPEERVPRGRPSRRMSHMGGR